jgi:hypothetical protein
VFIAGVVGAEVAVSDRPSDTITNDPEVLPRPVPDVVKGGSGNDLPALAVGNDAGSEATAATRLRRLGHSAISGDPGADVSAGGFDVHDTRYSRTLGPFILFA